MYSSVVHRVNTSRIGNVTDDLSGRGRDDITVMWPHTDSYDALIGREALPCQGDSGAPVQWASLREHIVDPGSVDDGGYVSITEKTTNQGVFVKHGCPRRQQSQNMEKISKSYVLNPAPTPWACDVSDVWATLRWTYSPSLVTVSPPNL